MFSVIFNDNEWLPPVPEGFTCVGKEGAGERQGKREGRREFACDPFCPEVSGAALDASAGNFAQESPRELEALEWPGARRREGRMFFCIRVIIFVVLSAKMFKTFQKSKQMLLNRERKVFVCEIIWFVFW